MSEELDHRRKPEPATGDSYSFKSGNLVLALAWLGSVWENLWPRLVPFFVLACLFISLSWFGLWQAVPDWLRWSGLLVFIALAIASLSRLKTFQFPKKDEINRRIEQASGFSHRPVSAQTDHIATEKDEFADALWREHQKRMAAQLDNLAAGAPKPNGNLFDRYALRAILPIAAFIALGFSYGSNGGRLTDIIAPRIDTQLVLSRLDMWISQPAYTAKPPIYFAAPLGSIETIDLAEATVKALNGSQLSISYVGEEDVQARFVQGASATRIGAAPDAVNTLGSKNYLTTLTDSGTIEVFVDDTVIASWPVSVEIDQIPTIRLEQVPSTALSGALELDYSFEDDFGVVSARGIISSIKTAKDGARPLVDAPVLDLPLSRARAKSGRAKVNRDLSSHPFAGSKVSLILEATDDPGQIGMSDPMTITLPGRRFVDPMAKALVEQRRLLALDANSAPYVANLLDAVTNHADTFEIDPKIFISLQTAYRMIAPANNDDKLREAMDILWEAALAIELGDLSEVERKLREAQEKLAEALENGASDEEIDKLMEELRQAMADFLEQMAKEMARNPIEQNPLANNQNTQTLTERDLEKMMQRIEDLAKSGSKDAARELLAEMQRMMDNLRAGQHQQQRQAEGNELNQALDKLSELMQKQQQLMDETFSMQRREPQPGDSEQQGQRQPNENGENQQGENGEQGDQPMTPQEFADAMEQLRQQQEQLQKQLGELGEQLEDLGLDPSKEFGEAGEEMGEAGENLGKGQSGDAAANQGQALEALRQGAQSMMQQMAGDRNQGGQQQGQAGDPNKGQQGTDPLGRRNDARGRVDDGDTKIPGEIDAQRAREIMDAIRKKLSDPLRPLLERNYLERLLNSRQ